MSSFDEFWNATSRGGHGTKLKQGFTTEFLLVKEIIAFSQSVFQSFLHSSTFWTATIFTQSYSTVTLTVLFLSPLLASRFSFPLKDFGPTANPIWTR